VHASARTPGRSAAAAGGLYEPLARRVHRSSES
jgi:hypothetical protein